MKAKVKYWIPTILWAAVIFFLSSRTATKTSEFYLTDFLIKKSAHFVEYAIFSWLLFRSLRLTSHLTGYKLFWVTFVATVLYAVSDEIHQTFVPSREGRLRDVIIDSAGALSALIIAKTRI